MTNEQKQCLLKYLGYYTADINGAYDTATKLATVSFQDDYGLKPDGIFGLLTEAKILEAVAGIAKPVEPAEKKNFWDEIKHFKKDEFRCKCGGKYCDGFPVEPSETLVRLADRVREHYGAPMIVSSGIRCITHNTRVGGAAASRHMRGLAMDFCVWNMPATIVLPYVQSLTEVRYAYAIDNNYIHMDVKL